MIIGGLALSGCAAGPQPRTQLDELLASVRALREENARLEARLARLEQRTVTQRAAPMPPPNAAAPRASSVDALPPLTVVKLKPKREPAPKISTAVEVVEPPEGVVEELKVAPADERADDTDLAIADAQFERGLDALKTGNPEGGVTTMQQFVTDWPRHPKADNALYFAGLGLMSQDDYTHAASLFQRVSAEYPAGDAVIEAMLKLAECRMRLNQPREARITWERIVHTYPGTAAATQAQARLVAVPAASAATP